MPLLLSWFKKSHRLGCFCAHENLNKLPFIYFCYYYPFVSKSCLHPWKKSLLSLGILNKKIKRFMNLLFICKPIKLRQL